jgi:hypothetical protein
MTLINVGSYPPKQCGIATFSQDLRKSLNYIKSPDYLRTFLVLFGYFNPPSGDKLLWLALRMAFVIIPNGIIPYLRSLGTPYFNPPSGDK